MNLFDQRPKLSAGVFVAPNASVIGSVEIETQSSVWCVRQKKSEQPHASRIAVAATRKMRTNHVAATAASSSPPV